MIILFQIPRPNICMIAYQSHRRGSFECGNSDWFQFYSSNCPANNGHNSIYVRGSDKRLDYEFINIDYELAQQICKAAKEFNIRNA